MHEDKILILIGMLVGLVVLLIWVGQGLAFLIENDLHILSAIGIIIAILLVNWIDGFISNKFSGPYGSAGAMQMLMLGKQVFFGGLFFVGILYAILFLIKRLKENTTKTKAPNIPPPRYEEGFAPSQTTGQAPGQPPLPPTQERLEQLFRANKSCMKLSDALERETEDLRSISAETCTILQDTRDKTVGAYTETGDEMTPYYQCVAEKGESSAARSECAEKKPSESRMAELTAIRKQNAIRRYTDELKDFAEGNKTTPVGLEDSEPIPGQLVECFSSDTEDEASSTEDLKAQIKSAESELRANLRILNNYTNDRRYLAINTLCDQIVFSMLFVNKLSEKGAKKMAEGENAAKKEKKETIDYFVPTSEESLDEMVKRAQLRAIQLLKRIDETKRSYAALKMRYDVVSGKLNRAASGTPSQDDLKTAAEPAPLKGRCPEMMFEYAQSEGGFCCPLPPTGYDFNSGEYKQCNPNFDAPENVDGVKRLKKIAVQLSDECDQNGYNCDKVLALEQKIARQCKPESNPSTYQLPTCMYVCSEKGENVRICNQQDYRRQRRSGR